MFPCFDFQSTVLGFRIGPQQYEPIHTMIREKVFVGKLGEMKKEIGKVVVRVRAIATAAAAATATAQATATAKAKTETIAEV